MFKILIFKDYARKVEFSKIKKLNDTASMREADRAQGNASYT